MQMIYFPWMHSEGAPRAFGLGVRFLHPGVGDDRQSQEFFVPEGLPLDRRSASRYMQEALSFGERFQDHKELEYLRAAGLEDFFSGTSSSLSDELQRRLGKSDRMEDPERQRTERGQMVLLLSWMLEEKLLEARSGERQYSELVDELRTSLGMEDGKGGDPLDFTELSGALKGPDSSSWPGLMPWFLLFLPEDGILYIDDGAIQASLAENGVETVPVTEASGYEELKGFALERGVKGDLAVTAGWRLSLKSRPEPDMPWLDGNYTVIFGRS